MKTESPPIPVSITDKLRALKAGKSIILPFAEGISARAIATRLRRDEDMSFKTKRDGDSIRIWRVA